MKLATVKLNGIEQAAIVCGREPVLIDSINEMENKEWSTDIFDLLQNEQLEEIMEWYDKEGKFKFMDYPTIPLKAARYGPLYRNPDKILGIEQNCLKEETASEEEPVCFMKPQTSLIGVDSYIHLPAESKHVTAEGELGIVIGKTGKNIAEEAASNYVAGFTTTLDMTAQDMVADDPRHLQTAKSFDSFFSFGPTFLTLDEFPDVNEIEVDTTLNGKVIHSCKIGDMQYSPWFLVSFFSQITTLNPGDVIMAGTPGLVSIQDGDTPGCHIKGCLSLKNKVTEEPMLVENPPIVS